MPSISIKTTGHASLSRPAERAILKINVQDSGTDNTTVSNNVLSCTRRIKEMIEPLNAKLASGEVAPDAAITHFSMGSLRKYTYNKYNNDGDITGKTYHVSTAFDVRFRDFEILASVGTELSAMPFVDLGGIEWQLTDATKGSFVSQVRSLAAKDALKRAEDYANTFNKFKVDVVEILDEDGAGGGFVASRRLLSMTVRQEGDDRNQLSFQPEDVEMSSTVTVKFITEAE
ncbi:hypothetical protein BJX99DRAFT_259303 [Aspergillus californicus]